MKYFFFFFFLACSSSTPVTPPPQKIAAKIITKTLDFPLKNGLPCRAYYHRPEGVSTPLPLVVSMIGSGFYTTYINGYSKMTDVLLKNGKVAALTIEKPGITYDPSIGKENEDDNFRLNFEQYRRHTLRDLTECALKATARITQAHSQELQSRLILTGHSQGTQVLALFYQKLLEEKSELLARIDTVIFSGVVMDQGKNTIMSQVKAFYPPGFSEKAAQRFEQAMQKGDDLFLMMYSTLPAHYMREEHQMISNAEAMKKLASFSPAAKFYWFQGTKDRNTPASLVEAFAAQNQLAQEKGLPHLKLEVKYYPSGHGLNEEAVTDMLKVTGLPTDG